MPFSHRGTQTSAPEFSSRLDELGLNVDLLHRCLERGQYAGDETTANHPRIARGQYVWAETNREIRDELVPNGWTKNEEDNIPRTVAPDGSFCVVAVSGNEGTGTASGIPSTRNPRGSAGIEIVQENEQLDLFPELIAETDRHLMRTWFLLYHRRGDTLYAELLLPTQVNKFGGISDWQERIILPPLDLSPGTLVGQDDEPDSQEEVDVPVQRRDA